MLCVTQRFLLTPKFATNAARICPYLARHQVVKQLTCSSRLLASESNQQHSSKPSQLNAKFIADDPRMSPRQRLKNLFTVYGPTAVVLHIGLSLTFLGITYIVVRFGLDVPELMQRYNYLGEKYMMIIASGGTFGLAYALYKAAMPLRVMVTLFLTPTVARKLQAYGIIKRKF